MRVRFKDMHDDIHDLALGESLEIPGLDMQTLIRRRGEITYYYQGHVEPHDRRFGDRSFPGTDDPNWDWRIVDQVEQMDDNHALWRLTLTKVLATG